MFDWYFSTLLIKPRIFNISVDTFSLNIFLYLLPQLLKNKTKKKVLSERYDIIEFLILLCLFHLMQ